MKRLFGIVLMVVLSICIVGCNDPEYDEKKFVGMKLDGFFSSALDKAEAEGHPARVVSEDGEVKVFDEPMPIGGLLFAVEDGKVTSVTLQGKTQIANTENAVFLPGVLVTIMGFFAFGSIAWWILSLCFIGFLFWELDREDGLFGSLFGVIIYLCVLQWICDVPVIGYIKQDPLWVAVYAIGFMFIGLAWSLLKWNIFTTRSNNEYKESRKAFLIHEGDDGATLESKVPDHLKDDWSVRRPRKPIYSENKAKISMWVMYWPLSMLWTICDDFIKEAFQKFIQFFKGWYDGIARRNLKSFAEDE